MAFPQFSFSGWNSSSLAPKVNPATVPPPRPVYTPGPKGQSPAETKARLQEFTKSLAAWGAANPVATGTLRTAPNAPAGQSIEGGMSVENGIVYQDGKLIGPIGSPAALALGVASSAAGSPGQLVGTTNAANTNIPAWLQSEMDRLNAQDALRNAVTGGGGGGGASAAPAFDPNLGVAAVTNARANFNQQMFQMNERARLAGMIHQRNLMQVGSSPGLYDLSGASRLDQQIRNFQQFNLPTASGWVGGGRPGSIWANGLLNGTGFA